MLDQGRLAETAWAAADHLVEKHFRGRGGFWRQVRSTHPKTVERICKFGYEGKAYATRFSFNRFPQWLRSAAAIMLSQYDGDPRALWSVGPTQTQLIYERFREFDGTGDALAKMGQFILIRNYGVAGGKKSQALMSVKPDVLVRRVLSRTAITSSDHLGTVVSELDDLQLPRPVDFDAALWTIGREYCFPREPRCHQCPLGKVCEYARA